VLAGVAACRLGWPQLAAGCRTHVLAHNPRHLLRRWPTLDAALDAERFQTYLKHIERQYPPERAEYMLGCLGQRPLFTGPSALETATAMLAKLAANRPTERPPGAGIAAGANGSDGAAGRPQRAATAPRTGRKRGAVRRSTQAVSKRLRGRKANQEFIWWPYWLGVGWLAAAIVVWAARRL